MKYFINIHFFMGHNTVGIKETGNHYSLIKNTCGTQNPFQLSLGTGYFYCPTSTPLLSWPPSPAISLIKGSMMVNWTVPFIQWWNRCYTHAEWNRVNNCSACYPGDEWRSVVPIIYQRLEDSLVCMDPSCFDIIIFLNLAFPFGSSVMSEIYYSVHPPAVLLWAPLVGPFFARS